MASEGEVPVVSPLNVEEVGMGAPSRIVIAPTSPPRPTDVGPSKKRFFDASDCKYVCSTIGEGSPLARYGGFGSLRTD